MAHFTFGTLTQLFRPTVKFAEWMQHFLWKELMKKECMAKRLALLLFANLAAILTNWKWCGLILIWGDSRNEHDVYAHSMSMTRRTLQIVDLVVNFYICQLPLHSNVCIVCRNYEMLKQNANGKRFETRMMKKWSSLEKFWFIHSHLHCIHST